MGEGLSAPKKRPSDRALPSASGCLFACLLACLPFCPLVFLPAWLLGFAPFYRFPPSLASFPSLASGIGEFRVLSVARIWWARRRSPLVFGLLPGVERTGTGLTPSHICTGNGLTPSHICTGTGLSLCLRLTARRGARDAHDRCHARIVYAQPGRDVEGVSPCMRHAGSQQTSGIYPSSRYSYPYSRHSYPCSRHSYPCSRYSYPYSDFAPEPGCFAP